MAWMLVSLASVKRALRVDHTDDDQLLILLISAASRRIHRHLKGQAGELLSIDSPPNSPPDDIESNVPEDIQAATIILTGYMYRNPDNDIEEGFEENELPRPVKALLKPLRDPALA